MPSDPESFEFDDDVELWFPDFIDRESIFCCEMQWEQGHLHNLLILRLEGAHRKGRAARGRARGAED